MFVIFTEFNRAYRMNDSTGATWLMDGDTWKPVAEASALKSCVRMFETVQSDLRRWEAINSRLAKEVWASDSVMAAVKLELGPLTLTSLVPTYRVVAGGVDWFLDSSLPGGTWRFA